MRTEGVAFFLSVSHTRVRARLTRTLDYQVGGRDPEVVVRPKYARKIGLQDGQICPDRSRHVVWLVLKFAWNVEPGVEKTRFLL
jgi:hypothetical protein